VVFHNAKNTVAGEVKPVDGGAVPLPDHP